MKDTLIIGAGAAGLAAAAVLRAAGRDVLVLEARHRVGGRCHSVEHEASPLPLELGAEFVHGLAERTSSLAARGGVPIVDIGGDHWRARGGGRLQRQHGFWEKVGRVIERIPDGPDISFGEFLGRRSGGRSMAGDRTLARAFVQGFHAADLDRISARSLAEAGDPSADPGAWRNGRTIGGYSRVLSVLEREVSDVVRFGARVRGIVWRPGHVRVIKDDGEEEARHVIVTVSPGVLAGGDVAIDPLPDSTRRALGSLAMGSVARVTLLFRERFWEDDERLVEMSFLHTPSRPFNIWWTAYPVRAPVIVGWSGGPPARELLRGAHGTMEDMAVRELAVALGLGEGYVRDRLVAVFQHDWDGDPFSRGAYSYPVVGGAHAGERLAQAVERTVWVAGEATAGAHAGTVEGALRSGERAARDIIG